MPGERRELQVVFIFHAQAVSYGAPATTTGGSTGGSDPLATIGSALAQAAFGGGLAQPAAAAQNTATFQSKAGRRMI